MKQYPSRLKYKKNHKPSSSLLYLNEKKNFFTNKGIMSLKSLDNKKLTYNQIEACRKSIRRMLKKQGLIFIRLFTNISLTKKPLASRMGKGKGSHSKWVCSVRKGQIICEVFSNEYSLAWKALNESINKLPIKAKVIYKKY